MFVHKYHCYFVLSLVRISWRKRIWRNQEEARIYPLPPFVTESQTPGISESVLRMHGLIRHPYRESFGTRWRLFKMSPLKYEKHWNIRKFDIFKIKGWGCTCRLRGLYLSKPCGIQTNDNSQWDSKGSHLAKHYQVNQPRVGGPIAGLDGGVRRGETSQCWEATPGRYAWAG